MGDQMLEALNEFLGRSTVDSSLKRAFSEGKLEGALANCGFSPSAAARLSQLEASSFSGYLQLLYAEVMREVELANEAPHPWPTDGLPSEHTERARRVEAA